MHTELPGPLCSTSDEIIAAIANLDDIVQHYQDRYNAFHARFCSLERGTASEDIVRAVFD
jgi:CDP-glycerol glycerophosphotransferase